MRFFLLLAAAAPLFAQTCTFTAAPNGFTFGSAANSNKFTVTTQPTCNWTAISNSPWIHITNPQNYIGTGGPTFDVEQNNGTTIRSGSITAGNDVNQTTVQITQFAANCSTTIAPAASINLPVTGGAGTLQITSGCPWQVGATVSWIKY